MTIKKKGPKRRRVRRSDKKACPRKVRFGTIEEAEYALNIEKQKGKLNLHSYKCTACGGYHLGHNRAVSSKFNYRIQR